MHKLKNSIFYILLYLLPKNLVSHLMGCLVSIRLPYRLTVAVNRTFANAFKIDLQEAERPLEEYACLQDFFIRHLKPGARPIAEEHAIVSPCDGRFSCGGKIYDGQLIQAKGKNYKIADLLKDKNLSERFLNGHYATIYLSPRDYHRFHVPMDGAIVKTLYIPGSLWPVNNWAVGHVKNLFCENERAITLIENSQGKMLASIAVGATMVGKIHLDYCDLNQAIQHGSIRVKKGDELGRFMFGSTIILLFEQGLMDNFAREAPVCVKMGEVFSNFA